MAVHEDFIISEEEYAISTTRSSGPGGQHVNKASTAVILRFNIAASSIPDHAKERLLQSGDNRITADGELIIRSSSRRSQLRNKEEAIARLHEVVRKALKKRKPRKATKPSKAAVEKRLEEKTKRGELKAMRKKIK